MDTTSVKKAVEAALQAKGSKNFAQTVDLIVNLKEMDIKKNDQQFDTFVTLPHSRGKVPKVCGLVGPELLDESKANLDETIEVHNFDQFKNEPKKIKKLADSYDFFVAQATIMPQVATVFGRVLGPRSKMPNPKAGCVMPPKAQLKPVKERLTNTIRVQAKTSLTIHAPVGSENQSADEIAANIMAVYNAIVQHTPQGDNNIKTVLVKLTMAAPVKVE